MHHHVTDLAFSKIFEDTIITGAVSIAVFKTFLAGDDDHERVLRWRNNSALLLTAEFGVVVGATAVDPTLRDMINWCIEKPNQGEKIDSDSDAMKALEAYIYWSNSGSVLVPGKY